MAKIMTACSRSAHVHANNADEKAAQILKRAARALYYDI